MSGFEVIVRPVILPDIRPSRPRILPQQDDPSQGIATLSGSGGGLIDLSQSESHSWSRSIQKEKKRKFDKERIYKKDDATGEVDKSTYVDVERLKWIQTSDGIGVSSSVRYADPPERDNVEILEKDQVRTDKDAA
jgi:hypothetical protein